MQAEDAMNTENWFETELYRTPSFPVRGMLLRLQKEDDGEGIPRWYRDDLAVLRPLPGSRIRLKTRRTSILLDENMMAVVNTSVAFWPCYVEGSPGDLNMLTFDLRLVSSFAGSAVEKVLRRYEWSFAAVVYDGRKPGEQQVVEELTEACRLAACEKEEDRLLFVGKLSCACHRMIRTGYTMCDINTDELWLRRRDRVLEMVSFMQEKYAEKLTVEQITAKAGLSASYGAKVFRNIMAMSIYRFLMTERLRHGREMLRETDLTVTEIAYRTGFDSSSNFINSFRRECGYTPHTYRKKIRG